MAIPPISKYNPTFTIPTEAETTADIRDRMGVTVEPPDSTEYDKFLRYFDKALSALAINFPVPKDFSGHKLLADMLKPVESPDSVYSNAWHALTHLELLLRLDD